jgi:histidine triad (HIT) family protein
VQLQQSDKGTKVMNHQDCIFCKIIAKEIPAKIIAQNDSVLVIQDISPKTPIHYLIIPKKHIADISQLELNDKALAGDLLLMAKQLSDADPKAKDFRLISNNGKGVGQTVFHIHMHFCAGKELAF